MRRLGELRMGIGALLLALLASTGAAAQGSGADGQADGGESGGKQVEAAAEPAAQELSVAEQIAQLETAVKADEQQLAELQDRLVKQTTEWEQAKQAFTELQQKKETLTADLEQAREAGDTARVQELQQQLSELEKPVELARERFDLAIAERENLTAQIAALERKLADERQELERLTTPEPAPAEPSAEPAAGTPAATEAPAEKQTAPAVPAPVPGMPAAPAAQPAAEPAEAKPVSEEEKQAQKEVAETEAALQKVEKSAESLQTRIDSVETEIEAIRQGLELARKKATNARETRETLAASLSEAEAGSPQHGELQQQYADADQRLDDAQAEISQLQGRLNARLGELTELQAQLATVLRQREEAAQKAEEKRSALEQLRNPFSPANLAQWFLDHGPKILFYILGIIVLRILIVFAGRRMVRVVSREGGPGTRRERELRAKTLVAVFQSTATVLVVVIGLCMILEEAGISVTAFLGVAAIATLAVGFAAQSIVKDYFHGFLILLENQYAVNDVVKIAGIGGLVERITLRTTVLRDLEGVVHFIPNSQITTASNMTHGWSRALFDVGVSYNDDVDRVMQVLVELGRELRQDPKFGELILEDPEMLGVDAFGDSAVVIKFFIKTRPLQQWAVKREYNRRMKHRFDELGIEIPWPHRTVYHRFERDNEEGRRAAETLSPAAAGEAR